MAQEQIKQAYKKATEYILEIPKFSGKHTMEETRAFYEFLGEPCRNKRIIHVAGTNGKGSVCSYLRNVLEEAGYCTAVFVSPHLVSIRERFLFDGEMVSREGFMRAYEAVYQRVHEFQKAVAQEGGQMTERAQIKSYHPSFFEYLFFMFLLMEQTKEADYVILETGLGGRLDATNIMPEKALCVITEIGLDHTEYLGETITQIAAEKAGIMRKGTPIVYASDKGESADVIKAQAEKLQVPAYPVGSRDFKIERITDKNIAFSFHSVYYKFISVMLQTVALYQVENASLALRAIDVLNRQGADITGEQILRGMHRTHWAGRMEEILPEVFVDGAHNEDGIRAFLASVREADKEKCTLVFAVVQDKHYEAMIRMIAESGLFQNVIITTTGGSRGTDPQEILALMQKYHTGKCSYYESAEEAFDACMDGRREEERIYIAGSLYLVGQIKAYIGRNSDD